MKTLLLIVFLLIGNLCFAQEIKIGGINGLHWGMSKKEVKKILSTKYKNLKEDGITISTGKTKFAGRDVEGLTFAFNDDSLHTVSIGFVGGEQVYNNIIKEVTSKYGEPSNDEYFLHSWDKGITQENYDYHSTSYENTDSPRWVTEDDIVIYVRGFYCPECPGNNIYPLQYQNKGIVERAFERVRLKNESDF